MVATNVVGDSSYPVPSKPPTTETGPGVPTDIGVIAGNTGALVSWTAPTNNGAPEITGHAVISTPVALNPVGNSPSSSASKQVSPAASAVAATPAGSRHYRHPGNFDHHGHSDA